MTDVRAIHLVRLDKLRPAVLLTRPHAVEYLTRLTVAPVTTTIRGLATEVRVDERNGLDHESVISCDNVVTVPAADVSRLLGFLTEEQEGRLRTALLVAYDL